MSDPTVSELEDLEFRTWYIELSFKRKYLPLFSDLSKDELERLRKSWVALNKILGHIGKGWYR